MRITISNKLIKKLQIEPGNRIYVRAGMKMIQSKLEIKSDLSQPYKLSSELSQFLQISRNDRKLQIRYDVNSAALQIGPFIGILSNSIPNRSEYDPKSLQAELIFLSKIGQTMSAEVFVFTPSCIDWSTNTTLGYVYKQITDNFGIWVESQYPLPDVVYDRIPSRAIEAQNSIKMTRRRLMILPDLKYFNPSFLNKWRVYQFLSANDDLSRYLPETKLFNQLNLEDMLDRHRILFIKPSNGSLGKGIIKAWRDKSSGIIHFVHGQKIIRHVKTNDVNEFLNKIQPIIKNKSYIVQQGIDLIRYQHAAFDIRIIYQKNGSGNWIISKKFVRVAAPGSSISNLSSGGKIEQSVIVLNHIFHNNKKLIAEKNEEMLRLCEMAATTLEVNGQGIFGELGLDIGINKNGQLCLIEINSKPRKTTETEMSKIIVNNTFRRPLEFAVYLAGFTNTKRK